MVMGTNVRTYFDGTWHNGDLSIMKAADHGSWLGSTIFDGARYFEGVAPDLRAHCERANRSAKSLMITPTVSTDDMVQMIWEGLAAYPKTSAVYIRPMYWAIDSGIAGIVPKENATGFAISLEEVAMPTATDAQTLTTTQFRRPVLEDNVTNAKAGCLYPNNARMLAEANAKGFDNALVADIMGNVAETASANVFMAKDGELFTPIANNTFLAGITRARHMENLRNDGIRVHETILTFDDFHGADEVFLSGNYSKVTPISEFDGTNYQMGPLTKRARETYWDWAHSDA